MGDIGSVENPLEIDSSFQAVGEVNADALGGIYLTEMRGDLNVGVVISGWGDVTLVTLSGSILDAHNDDKVNVTGDHVHLEARAGSIGEAGDPVEIASDTSRFSWFSDGTVNVKEFANVELVGGTSLQGVTTSRSMRLQPDRHGDHRRRHHHRGRRQHRPGRGEPARCHRHGDDLRRQGPAGLPDSRAPSSWSRAPSWPARRTCSAATTTTSSSWRSRSSAGRCRSRAARATTCSAASAQLAAPGRRLRDDHRRRPGGQRPLRHRHAGQPGLRRLPRQRPGHREGRTSSRSTAPRRTTCSCCGRCAAGPRGGRSAGVRRRRRRGGPSADRLRRGHRNAVGAGRRRQRHVRQR